VKALDAFNVKVDCIIVAVAHDEFREIALDDLKEMMNDKPMLVDVRAMFDMVEAKEKGFYYKTL